MYQTMGLDQQLKTFESEATTIKAMLKQEESGYIVRDYLHDLPSYTSLGQPVDARARSTIADWCVKIMDVCQYQRETAEIAVSYLDRFMASPDGYSVLLDRSQFQLAALACVYSAVKVHEEQALGPELVAKLSNGERTSREIEAMELRVLQAVQWRVNPPTAMAFVRNHIDLIPDDDLDGITRQALLDLTQYQIDMSLLDYEFVMKKASLVGLAALLNAADSISDAGSLAAHVGSLIFSCTGIRPSAFDILRNQLYEMISTKETSDSPSSLPTLRKPVTGLAAFTRKASSCFASSPRTVQIS